MNKLNREVLDPKKKKPYKKMMKKYRKLLLKQVRKMGPFDVAFGGDLFITFLKWMRDYYKLGYNVWAIDNIDPNQGPYTEKTRADSLDEALRLYNRWQTCCDDYYKIAHNEDEVKHYLKLGFHLVDDTDDVIERAMRKLGAWTLTLYKDSKENVEKCDAAEEDYKHQFFEYLEEHMLEWWDA